MVSRERISGGATTDPEESGELGDSVVVDRSDEDGPPVNERIGAWRKADGRARASARAAGCVRAELGRIC
jgi:hypothetical protein